MKTLLQYWPVVAFTLSLLGAGLVGGVRLAIDQHLKEDARRDERIRVLEAINGAEHPAYWPMIWAGK